MWQTLSTLTTSLKMLPTAMHCQCERRRQRNVRSKQRCPNFSNNTEMQSHLLYGSASSTATTTAAATAADSMTPTAATETSVGSHGEYNTRRCSCCSRNKANYTLRYLMLLLCCLCLVCDDAHATLRDVNLLPEPPAVRRGQSVTLYCLYELDGAPLYSIKFYRGLMEFYRFTPGEFPHTKVFQYPGIKVDEPSSNGSMVMIRNVGFGLAGNFSCEVTADAPLYSTATAYANVQVTQLPEARPTLLTEHLRYEPGDILRANCSAPPSRPRAELRFTINNIPVSSDDEIQYIRTVENLITARLNLKLQLQSAHFTNAHGNRNLQLHGLAVNTMYMTNALIANAANGHAGNAGVSGGGAGAAVGSLMLRCTAKIGDLYQDYKEIELGTPQKDPVPARVTLSTNSGLRNFFETYFNTSGARATSKKSNSIGCIIVVCYLISLCWLRSNNS